MLVHGDRGHVQQRVYSYAWRSLTANSRGGRIEAVQLLVVRGDITNRTSVIETLGSLDFTQWRGKLTSFSYRTKSSEV